MLLTLLALVTGIANGNDCPDDVIYGSTQHFVAYRLTCCQIAFESQFLSLFNKCKRNGEYYVRSIASGRINSPYPDTQGFDLGFLVGFASQSDRDYFVGKIDGKLPDGVDSFDPDHDQFKQSVESYLYDVRDVSAITNPGSFSFDFVANENGAYGDGSGRINHFGPNGYVLHFKAFKFQDTVTTKEKDDAMADLLSLKDKSVDPKNGKKLIVSVVEGEQNSKEGKGQEYTHGALFVFDTVTDRDVFSGKMPGNIDRFDKANDDFKDTLNIIPWHEKVTELPANYNPGKFVFDFTTSGCRCRDSDTHWSNMTWVHDGEVKQCYGEGILEFTPTRRPTLPPTLPLPEGLGENSITGESGVGGKVYGVTLVVAATTAAITVMIN